MFIQINIDLQFIKRLIHIISITAQIAQIFICIHFDEITNYIPIIKKKARAIYSLIFNFKLKINK